MATIDSGSSNHGRKSINHELPLVPFIDLLLCCVMFLLVTAVWAQLGEMDATMPQASADAPPDVETARLDVSVSQDGYTLRSSLGTETEIPVVEGEPDLAALQTQLTRFRLELGTPSPVRLQPDDDVGVGTIAATMDILRGEGFADIAFPEA